MEPVGVAEVNFSWSISVCVWRGEVVSTSQFSLESQSKMNEYKCQFPEGYIAVWHIGDLGAETGCIFFFFFFNH